MATATTLLAPDSCSETALLVVAVEHLDTLAERLRAEYRTVAFPHGAAWDAIQAVETLRPALVVLDEPFAATSRGALLINRASACGCVVRLVSDADYQRLNRSVRTSGLPGHPLPASYAGARRERRFPPPSDLPTRVGGHPAEVVNLSPHGAQIVTSRPIYPGRLVRLAVDYGGRLQCTASVVWATVEPAPEVGCVSYRAGLEVVDGDLTALADVCADLTSA